MIRVIGEVGTDITPTSPFRYTFYTLTKIIGIQ